jgi:tetratricopeptide (TPR) repeat protein
MSARTALALVLGDRSKFAEAEAEYRKVIDAKSGLAVQSALWEFVASAYDNCGVVLLRVGRVKESEAAHEAGLALRRRLAPQLGESSVHQFNLVVSYCNLATNLAPNGRPKEALPYLLEAIPLGEKLMAGHPGIPMYQNAVAGALNNLGGVHTLLGDNKSARDAHQRAFAIRQEMLADHPAVLEYAIRAACSLTNLGELEVRENQTAVGLEWLDKSVAQLEDVLRREPSESTARYYMSYTQSWRAKALDQLGRCGEALAAWDRAIQLDAASDAALRAGREACYATCGGKPAPRTLEPTAGS